MVHSFCFNVNKLKTSTQLKTNIHECFITTYKTLKKIYIKYNNSTEKQLCSLNKKPFNTDVFQATHKEAGHLVVYTQKYIKTDIND